VQIKLLLVTARRVTFEVENFGIWYANEPYEVYLNGTRKSSSNRTVHTVGGLKPETDYELIIRTENQEAAITLCTLGESVTLDVRRFGARGDGICDDTLAIQTAIMACPPKGRVWIPEGEYLIRSLFLKSGLTLELARGATLKGDPDPEKLALLPGMVQGYGGEYNFGTWEGNPLDTYVSLLTGIGVEDVVICGEGTIDGGSTMENWWNGGETRTKFGPGWRPRMVFLNRCKNVTLQGIEVKNSPSWNIHPYFSEDIRLLDLRIESPDNSPNTDGINPESTKRVEIAGVYISVGDDCVAIKSGKYALGQVYQVRTEDIEIRQCYMHRGHGSVTLGSEIAMGVRNLLVRDCIFHDTDRGFRVKTRRGRGRDAVIDNIRLERIQMRGVYTPFVINCYYWCCDPDGRSEYVRSKDPLPIDARTPELGRFVFRNIQATDAHVAAGFIYGLPEAKIQSVDMQSVHISFAEEAKCDYPAMMADVEPCSKRGLFIRNVIDLNLQDVQIKGQLGLPLDVEPE